MGTGERQDHVQQKQPSRLDLKHYRDGLQQHLVLSGGGLQLSTHKIFMPQRAPQYFDALFLRGELGTLQTLALGSAASAVLCISSQLGGFLLDRFQT